MKVMKRSGRHSARLICLVVISASWRCSAADLSGGICDPGLQPAGGVEIGYAPRGDRCEGLYVQEVSGGALGIVSLAEYSKSYEFTKDHALLLEWPAFVDELVRIRASSLKQKFYYRMDTVRTPKILAYTWPSDVVARLKLGRDDIGLLAWTEDSFRGRKRKIHLPLRAMPEPASILSEQNANRYEVVLMSSVELQEVYVTLRPLNSNVEPGDTIRKSRKLELGYYPAGKPIRFPIHFSELSGAPKGLYSLSVGAELSNGEPRNAEVCFYHALDGNPWGKPKKGQP
jgi:hypothetical protein